LFVAADSGGEGELTIPVLMSLEPGRLGYPDTQDSVNLMEQRLHTRVADGMRASLETGNLITGSLYVTFDIFPDAPRESIGRFGEYMTIPNMASGLEGLGRQVSGVLKKVDELPIEETVAELNATLRDLRKVIDSEEVEKLPANVNASLADLSGTLESFSQGSPAYEQLLRAITELTRALQSIEDVSRTLSEQPNALVFDKPIEPDPELGGAE
jgi:paraquat-inducible protein B